MGKFATRVLCGGAFAAAAALQVYVQRSPSSSSSGTGGGLQPLVDETKLVPGTQLMTFAQCIGKKDLDKGVWKTRSFSESPQCGEDSFFIADAQRSFGVADGVGGWSRQGVNPKEFSEKLMVETKKHIAEVQRDGLSKSGNAADLDAAITAAHKVTLKAVSAGSSTVCAASLDSKAHTLQVVNLGDSGLVVVRNGRPVFVAKESSHGWNFPKQIGVNRGKRHGTDTIHDGHHESVKVYQGDMVVTASDGVLDNLTINHIAQIVGDARGDAPAAARNVLVAVCESALNITKSHEQPKRWQDGGVGGKPDDITVLVTKIL